MEKYSFNWDFEYKETVEKAGKKIAKYMRKLPHLQDFEMYRARGGLWGNPYRIRVIYHAPREYKQELQSICRELRRQEKAKTVTFDIPELYDD